MADYTGKSIEELNKLLEEKIEENRDLEDMKDDPEIAELISENNTEIDKINQILVMDEKPEGVSDTAVQEQEETEVSDEDDDLDDIIDDVKSRDEVSEDLYKEDEIVEEEKEVKVEDLPKETEPASQVSDETFDFSSIVKGMEFEKGGSVELPEDIENEIRYVDGKISGYVDKDGQHSLSNNEVEEFIDKNKFDEDDIILIKDELKKKGWNIDDEGKFAKGGKVKFDDSPMMKKLWNERGYDIPYLESLSNAELKGIYETEFDDERTYNFETNADEIPNEYAKGGMLKHFIGDEGMFRGGEFRIKSHQSYPNRYSIIELDDNGNEIGKEYMINQKDFEDNFSKFAKGGKVESIEKKIKLWADKMNKALFKGDMKAYNIAAEKVQQYEKEYEYHTFDYAKGGKTNDIDIYYYKGTGGFNSYTVVIDDDVYEMNESDMPNMSVDTYLGNRSRFPSDVSHWGRRLDYENLPMTIKVKIEQRKKHKYDNGGVVPNVYEVELIENVEKDPKREFFVVNENTYNEITKLQYAGGFKRFEIDLYEDDSKKEMSNINDLERYVNSIGINPELEFAEGGVIQDMIDGFQDLLTGITDEDAEIHKQIDYLKRML